MDREYKPVRNIGMNYTSLTGTFHGNKTQHKTDFESSLERDFIYLQEFNNNVYSYYEQPVEIEYELDGKLRTYTPDFLVQYRDDVQTTKDLKPTLFEIKYRKNLWEDWKDLKPKFFAANSYAKTKGWNFKILTEKEIRGEYLDNVKFLWHYKQKSTPINESDVEILMGLMHEFKQSSPNELILAGARDPQKRAELLYTVWYLIAIGYIECDLTNSLKMNTSVWID